MFAIGTKVSWKLKDESPGHGIVIGVPALGKVLVVVHHMFGAGNEYHYVINCTLTWLTEIKE